MKYNGIEYNGQEIDPSYNGEGKEVAAFYNGKLVYPRQYDVKIKLLENKGIRTFQGQPEIGHFVYSDHTWSKTYHSEKTCVGIITEVRGKDFDFIALEDVDAASPVLTTSSTSTDSGQVVQAIALAPIEYDGLTQTKALIELPTTTSYGREMSTAASICLQYSADGFEPENGYYWYLPQYGQLVSLYASLDTIQRSLELAGGTEIDTSTNYYYKSSGRYSSYCVFFNFKTGLRGTVSVTSSSSLYSIRPFCTYTYNNISDGVYIYDTSGNYYTADEWSESGLDSSDALGIGVVSDPVTFLITGSSTLLEVPIAASTSTYWSNHIPISTSSSDALYDTRGEVSTRIMYKALGSGSDLITALSETTLSNGRSCYASSFYEYQKFSAKLSSIETCAELIGYEFLYGSSSYYYATVTGYSTSYPYKVYTTTAGSTTTNAHNTSWTATTSSGRYYIPLSVLPYNGITEGAFIYGSDSNLYTSDTWGTVSGVEAVGIAVVSKYAQFAFPLYTATMSTTYKMTSSAVTGLENIYMNTTKETARVCDFDGYQQTNEYISQVGLDSLPAITYATSCTDYFGEIGYIGSYGEYYLIYKYYSDIDTLHQLLTGYKFSTYCGGKNWWTTTLYSDSGSTTVGYAFKISSSSSITTTYTTTTVADYVLPLFRLTELDEVTDFDATFSGSSATDSALTEQISDTTWKVTTKRDYQLSLSASGYYPIDTTSFTFDPAEDELYDGTYTITLDVEPYNAYQRFYKRFATAGDDTWIVPHNCTSTDIFLVGGGGAPCTGSTSTYYKTGAGGGYTMTFKGSDYEAPDSGTWDGDWFEGRDGNAMSVTPGEEIALYVGAGGTPSTSTANGIGEATWFYSEDSAYVANPGYGGRRSSSSTSIAGGVGGTGGGLYNYSAAVDGTDGGGTGQGHTTRDFGEMWGKVNAISGGGSSASTTYTTNYGGYTENGGIYASASSTYYDRVYTGYGGAGETTSSSSYAKGGAGTVYLRFYRNLDPYFVVDSSTGLVDLGVSPADIPGGSVVIDFEVNSIGYLDSSNTTQMLIGAGYLEGDDYTTAILLKNSSNSWYYSYTYYPYESTTTGEVVIQDRMVATLAVTKHSDSTSTPQLDVQYKTQSSVYDELSTYASSSSTSYKYTDSNFCLGEIYASTLGSVFWIYDIKFYDADGNLYRHFTPSYGNKLYEEVTGAFCETSVCETLSDYWSYLGAYGVQRTVGQTSCTLTRIGSTESHQVLPVQSEMKGCLLSDDGTVVEYLPDDDWSSADLTGSSGQVMVEIPEHWAYWSNDGTTEEAWICDHEISGFTHVSKMYVSAYRVGLSSSKLYSASGITPWTTATLTTSRTYARNRGSYGLDGYGWNCYTYLAFRTIFWLYVIEYASVNAGLDYNSELTSDGYHQGGIGPGLQSTSYTGYTTGYTDTLGNSSGEVAYDSSNNANRYRGLEGLWDGETRAMDGSLIYNGYYYYIDSPSKYSSTSISNYTKATATPSDGNTFWFSSPTVGGGASEILWDENGNIFPTELNSSFYSASYAYGFGYTTSVTSTTTIYAANTGFFGRSSGFGNIDNIGSYSSFHTPTTYSDSYGQSTRLVFYPAE